MYDNLREKVINWIDLNSDQIVSFLQEIIRVPSVNPWFFDEPGESSEGDVQDIIQKKMEDLGAQVKRWEPDPDKLVKYKGFPNYTPERGSYQGRPNLYAEIPGQSSGKSILLFGHIDVVKAGSGWREAEPFSGLIKNGKVYGRGAVDMKGGVASMIMAIEAVKSSGIPLAGSVKVGTVVDEETGGMGILSFIDEGYRADACILTEPTDFLVAPLCRGILWGKITIKGRSGHIEIPHGHWSSGGAVDAIKKARYFMDMIDNLNYDWARRKVHPLQDLPCQIYIAQINGGEYPTAFANEVELVFNAQYLPSERDDKFRRGGKVQQEILDFIKNVSNADPWLRENQPTVEWYMDADCAETPSDHEFVQLLSKNVNFIRGQSVVKGIGFHTDMGWLVNSGIPTINFAAGDPRVAHQSDEHIKIEDLIDATKSIALTILDWCGED